MVKFLHTADLHLGKIFHDYSLIEDQRYMLSQLEEILSGGGYGALLIAGDVYDRSIPSPEAVALFGSFLGSVKRRCPALQMLILPGNHDSPSRLGFGRELFRELGVHFVTDPEQSAEPVRFDQQGERCAFFLLPFLNSGSLRSGPGREASGEGPEDGAERQTGTRPNLFTGEAAPGGSLIRSQAQLVREAASRLEAARRRTGADYTVLGAHLFVLGGLKSESERNFLGGAEQVDPGLFAGFDYVALGHLHRFQKAAANAWYSGSPLAYSFDEADQEKVFLSVELSGAGSKRENLFGETEGSAEKIEVKPVPVSPLRRLRRLEGPFDFFYRDPGKDRLLAEAEEDYLEVSLTDKVLVENPLALLRRRFPYIMSIKQREAFAALSVMEPAVHSQGERRDALEDFADFLTDIYGQADPVKLELFRKLLEELELEDEAPGQTVRPAGNGPEPLPQNADGDGP
ncbi:MAG: exonuclease SbcCD subunit D [Treponema sp.]|jgi:exonuclease SbcD|nr:exonuclease SbcCD subunit D [Treponema sp.]